MLKKLILCGFLRVRSKKVFVFISVITIPFFTINSCSRIWSIGILNQKDKTVTLILKLQIPVSQNHFQSWITGHHSENLNLPSIDFRNWFRVRSESIAYSNRSKFEEKIQLENIQYNRVVEKFHSEDS
ncbi:hypothetical protein LEP1GSC018_2586 [Leptospira kirschneri str. 2008720114]|uniref:hypothetical protein n=1 Tax=Leptospira kirschneri TaxID=29507 RepID=UPI000297EFA0|nr:hypothetical protein [Leptospira kirschneri]EKP05110.1 hypothetical protein LEP1GSC018_2586 [Leptospira kirschneri str. 2008720114]KON79028.1 Uncharacterized protein NV38_0000333 [Leptospira kirschneri serovar Mozdok]